MDFADLKIRSREELTVLLDESRAQMHALKIKAVNRQLKQVHQIADLRKTIARILVLLRTK